MNQLWQEFCGGGGSDVIVDNLVLRKIPSWRALSGTLSWCSLLGSCDCLGVSREPVVFRKRLLRVACRRSTESAVGFVRVHGWARALSFVALNSILIPSPGNQHERLKLRPPYTLSQLCASLSGRGSRGRCGVGAGQGELRLALERVHIGEAWGLDLRRLSLWWPESWDAKGEQGCWLEMVRFFSFLPSPCPWSWSVSSPRPCFLSESPCLASSFRRPTKVEDQHSVNECASST